MISMRKELFAGAGELHGIAQRQLHIIMCGGPARQMECTRRSPEHQDSSALVDHVVVKVTWAALILLLVSLADHFRLRRFTKGATSGNYDNDGYPDLYVSKFSSENFLYHNNRDGTFSEIARDLHVEKPIWSFPSGFSITIPMGG
jgi:hypothetical protein